VEEVDRLRERFTELVELRQKRDLDKATAERSAAAYNEYEAELWEEINESSIRGAIHLEIPGHGHVAFQKRETYRGRVLNEHELIAWAEENGMLAEFTTPSISKARLNEIVRTKIEAREPLPPGSDFTATRYISMSFKNKDK